MDRVRRIKFVEDQSGAVTCFYCKSRIMYDEELMEHADCKSTTKGGDIATGEQDCEPTTDEPPDPDQQV